MSLTLLDSENADRDLTTFVTALTHTPSASLACYCRALLVLGDEGGKALDGTGGNFELQVKVGGVYLQPKVTTIAVVAGATAAHLQTSEFLVPANKEVIIEVKSPNGADTSVDCSAYLYDLSSTSVMTGGIVADSLASGAITAAKFAAGAIDSAAIATDACTKIATTNLLDLADGIETNLTLRQALKVMSAVLCGTVSGGPGSPVFKSARGSTTRVSATADGDGNRSAVTLSL